MYGKQPLPMPEGVTPTTELRFDGYSKHLFYFSGVNAAGRSFTVHWGGRASDIFDKRIYPVMTWRMLFGVAGDASFEWLDVFPLEGAVHSHAG